MNLPDRATIANMAPEYGATCGFFPADQVTLDYLVSSGRDPSGVEDIGRYLRANSLFRHETSTTPKFTSTIHLDLSSVVSSMAGPKRPQDKILLSNVSDTFINSFEKEFGQKHIDNPIHVKDEKFQIDNGHVAIAAITSCTNTSNPSVMIGAGILAQKAIKMGA